MPFESQVKRRCGNCIYGDYNFQSYRWECLLHKIDVFNLEALLCDAFKPKKELTV